LPRSTASTTNGASSAPGSRLQRAGARAATLVWSAVALGGCHTDAVPGERAPRSAHTPTPARTAASSPSAAQVAEGPAPACRELAFPKAAGSRVLATGVSWCSAPGANGDLVVTELPSSCGGLGFGPEELAGVMPRTCQSKADCGTPESECIDGVCHAPPKCDSAADCESAHKCVCALHERLDHGSAARHPTNECVPVECSSAADCGGLACAMTQDSCGRVEAVRCHKPGDACRASSDCQPTERCAFIEARNSWACVEARDCD